MNWLQSTIVGLVVPLSAGCVSILPGGGASPPPLKADPRVHEIARQCAPRPSHVAGRVFIGREETSIETNLPQSLSLAFRACMTARVVDYGLGIGIYVFEVDMEGESVLRDLPYPLPKATSRSTLAHRNVRDQSDLAVMAGELAANLSNAGFSGQFKWFRFLDGFAVITTPEKISETGEPISLDGKQRFEPAYASSSHGDLLDWLWMKGKAIIFTDTLFRRAFVFTCASGKVQDSVALSSISGIPGGGDAQDEVPNLPFDSGERSYVMRSFVYVFEQKDGADSSKPTSISVNAESALRSAGILPWAK
jgi:hypothetical protein